MLPGFSAELMPKGREKESQAKLKRYMTMMDSMTDEGKQKLSICSAFLFLATSVSIEFDDCETDTWIYYFNRIG